jgi:hypothetical protein
MVGAVTLPRKKGRSVGYDDLRVGSSEVMSSILPAVGVAGVSCWVSGSGSDSISARGEDAKGLDDGDVPASATLDSDGLVKCPINDVTSYWVALEACLPSTGRVGELGVDGTSIDPMSKEVGTSRRDNLALWFARIVLNDARIGTSRSAAVGGSGNIERENSLGADELVSVLSVRLLLELAVSGEATAPGVIAFAEGSTEVKTVGAGGEKSFSCAIERSNSACC